MVLYEDSDATLNVVRIWNKETTKTPLMRLGCGNDEDVIELRQDYTISTKPIHCNTYNSNGNNNLVFQQNSSTIAFYDKDDVNYPSGIFKYDTDVSINTSNFIQCQTMRAHIFDSHPSLETSDNDISFRYAGTVYMFYDKSLSNFQMRTDIVSDSNITCVALTETSDEKMKEDIDFVHTNCSDVVKKIPVRKYHMKNDKNKKLNIGFVAQECLSSITDFENVVDVSGDTMSLNYGRMCSVLWKCVQEQMERVDKLEAEITELKRRSAEPREASRPKTRTRKTTT